ncbi:MAG: hypothetical protein A2W90_15150 [Bacteroidetes bacterium GWF2_42_66]|nr:MAG: hypothetical protein A2W92_16270 [Bacteroidetes bacterium GWA2_42_15]OFX99790.1 MAG: hypothetical protein A2W89_07080 [Bacteroidetes bacterium GWE2_42_39]OFY46646.1 MAG: hypothetical protein A2W90_15150 [Bacteroidetes bacterium GWF2_42_66]HBL74772.1 hypothetical protein [Prolixibacteraceae bacterium]HCU59501.1 hypothetical protein [Prolixibacteraceae bacterium]
MDKLKANHCITGFVVLLLLLPTLVFSVVLENDNLKYEIAKDGRNLHFIDKATGIDYLYTDSVSYCASILQDGKEFHATSVFLKNNLLFLGFGNSGVSAEVRIEKTSDYITMEVVKVGGEPESLTFINIPLKLEGMPYESFAACVLSLNLFTHVRQLPALQTHLWANCCQRFGMKEAKIALLGVPQKNVLPVIRSVMEKSEEIPHSTAGGAWAQMSKEGYGSYLMNFGTLTEETVPEWIKMCSDLGFNQIDSHGGGGDFFKFGDFVLNPEKWSDGWTHFKRINQRLHDAGISSIFHTYAFFIDKKSKYGTPVPHPDLAYSRSFTLAETLTADASEIVVQESTADISTITGFFVRNSLTLRIGEELISFNAVTKTPPYKFTGCKRGVNGTKNSSHAPQDKAYHLKEMFGLFVPGPETPLFLEIARRTAEIVNECNFDGIYFDAIDGSDILDGPENVWYYGTKFIFEVAKHLERPVGMEMSAMEHHWWHYRSRWQAWDRPVRGYKQFIDIHAAAIKTKEYEHGAWRGYAPFIEKYGPAENGGLLLPLHLGWWGNQTWDPPQVEPTFPDDIEYLCCKMIGNNAGLSMLGGADQKTLDENPLFKRLMPIIKQYEELRHQSYFSDSVRSLLRQPGKEFRLFQDKNGTWNFKPIAYQKHKVAGLNHPSATWKVQNEFGSQSVRLRIEPLMSVKSYDDPDGKVLADFSIQNEFTNETAKGVYGEIKNSTEKTVSGDAAGIFSASSSGTSPREGSWIRMEKKFEPWLNLEKNQALGVWINGDGNGELLNFRIESPQHISFGARGDHFIKIDFTGWKYFELVEIESSEFCNYIWPGPGLYIYDSFRHQVNFSKVDKLQIWYNNLPSGKEISCQIGPVKALPMVTATIRNPSVTINGEKIAFQVTLESGMSLEFNSASDCKLYGPKGEFLKDVKIEGTVPSLVSGENEISFSGNGPDGINPRVQVTVISEGKPLKNK